MIRKYAYALIWAAMVLFVCGINGNSLPKISFEIGIDKIAHFILFGIQAWLIILADHKKEIAPNWKRIHLAVAIGIVYGIVIEILQATIFINRTYDYADMLANSVGAVSCYGWVYLRFRKG